MTIITLTLFFRANYNVLYRKYIYSVETKCTKLKFTIQVIKDVRKYLFSIVQKSHYLKTIPLGQLLVNVYKRCMTASRSCSVIIHQGHSLQRETVRLSSAKLSLAAGHSSIKQSITTRSQYNVCSTGC